MDQRIQPAEFFAVAGGLNVLAPSNPNLAPPGHYMLFILNGNGVPSVAKIIQVTSTPGRLPASIALSFNGQIRDRVGEGETALSADGAMDGTFTVTLSAGSGNRTVTRLDLARAGVGNWDTQPNNGFWVLGAASTLDAALFNAANGTVNFPLTAGSSFNIFASNFEGAMFVAGSSFTLTVSFADGSTATATASIGALPPVPGLTTLSPNSATAGGPAFTLTVNGSNFVSGSVVQWNGTVRTTTFVSATQLTAAIPASDIAAAGTAQVTVANPGGGTSNALTFTINTGTPAPSLTTLSPNSGTAGGPAFTLTVNGSNFVSGSVVQWNGSARTTTFVSATQLTAAIPASDIAAAGTAQVRVANPGGGTSNALTFTITSPGFTLTVTRSGNGTVTSTPTGINCGSTCAAAYSAGTVVTLTATPQNKNFPFLGWSGGGCSGTGQCTLTMDANKQVTATFGKN